MCSREFYYDGGGSNELLPDGAMVEEVVDGFIGILRQLGDLAQLASEVFQGMHDQVMAVSARGHQLALRIKHLDAVDLLLPPLHKHTQDYCSSSSFFCHKDHCLFVASNIERVHWRANVLVKQGVVAGGNNNKKMPSFIFESIERCRGPPKLSLLDKYDADGEGACLKRYTNPSFFRSDPACSTSLIHQTAKTSPKETRPISQCSDSENSRTPKAAQCSDSMPEIDAYHGFLSMFRHLKYRQTNGSTRPHMHNFQNERCKDRSPESSIEVKEDITVSTGTCTDSVSEERNCYLERTSSFEAWLSPNAHNLQHDQIAEGMSHYTCNNEFVSHVNPNDTIGATNNANSKEDSNTYKKKAVSKRSKYKGGVEFITSRVSSFPRKLFTKKQDPHPVSVADSFRNMTTKILELKCNNILDNDSGYLGPNNREDRYDGKRLEITHPVNLASPSIQEELMLPGESDKPSSPEDMPALAEVASDEKSTKYTQNQSDYSCEASYDTLLDEELHQPIVHQERNGSSVPKLCSTTSIAQEDCGDPTPGNAYSEGPRKDMVPPLPPIQWLSSIKVHPGSRVATPKLKKLRPQSPAVNHEAVSNYVHPVKEQLETGIIQARSHYSILSSDTEMAKTSSSNVKSTADKSNRDETCRYEFPDEGSEEIHHQEKDVFQPSEGEILNSTKVCEPTVQSDEARPELSEIKLDPHAEVQSQREEKQQIGNEDSGCNKHNLRLSSKEKFQLPQVDVQKSPDHPTGEDCNTNVHVESVFLSAVEQLTKLNPPSVPRPKYSLLQVRTPPGLTYPSRKLSGERSKLHEQINDKCYELKPGLGRGSNVTVDDSNTKVATILQRVDHIRQAHTDNYDVDSEVSWSDSD